MQAVYQPIIIMIIIIINISKYLHLISSHLIIIIYLEGYIIYTFVYLSKIRIKNEFGWLTPWVNHFSGFCLVHHHCLYCGQGMATDLIGYALMAMATNLGSPLNLMAAQVLIVCAVCSVDLSPTHTPTVAPPSLVWGHLWYW